MASNKNMYIFLSVLPNKDTTSVYKYVKVLADKIASNYIIYEPTEFYLTKLCSFLKLQTALRKQYSKSVDKEFKSESAYRCVLYLY